METVLLDALESISDAFVIYDDGGYLVTCNAKFRELYQYSEEETAPGVHYQELGKIDVSRGNVVISESCQSKEDYLDQKKEYRQRLEGSFIVQLKDKRWIKTTDRRLSSGGFVSIQRDITEEKRNEEALLSAKKTAELANRAKSEFLANMSHELRTPLNAIIGFSSLLSEAVYGPHSDHRYKEYARDIEEAGSHLLNLINEVLDLSKVEVGDIVLSEKTTDIWQISQSCKALTGQKAKENKVRLNIKIDPPTLRIHADPIKLKQILVNLASNAIKFSKPEGTVDILWSLKNGKIKLTVTDHGVGIEKEFLPHIFEPFRRSQISSVLNFEGTGLGLTLVKKFSDAHGADLTLSSIAGEGTTVTVIFPKSRTCLDEELLVT
ncbi:sensor histidine kinase [Sneathiella aquimaris]|uniref:sensor histidine kinase n=1 Tax=Sneathiella aquimaris TaxID=2599305 RepID=UPI00146B7F34|nr:PAS domain-containing sensor histidine kinase [Sneathiella aquimaris]